MNSVFAVPLSFALAAITTIDSLADESSVIAAGDHTGLKIEANVSFTEGPAWHAPSKSVFFTDIINNRIMRRDALGALHIYRTPSGRANGLFFDRQNRLLACEGGPGNRRVTRTEADGTITILTADFKGAKYKLNQNKS